MNAAGRATSRLRWLAPALLVGLQLGVWVALYSGGMRAVTAFLLLVSLVPAAGVLSLVIAGIVALRRGASRPLLATCVVAVPALWPGLWNLGVGMITFPSRLASTEPAVSVRLPSNERLRVAWGGDSVATNYHAAYPDQRWAYDLTVEPSFVGSKRHEDYGCWGSVVVAPISATVHVAEDSQPDQQPMTISTDAPLGNYVVLRLPTGTFLLVAHLQRNSLQVRAGDWVEEGQPLARCGNSGHTSEPHIHIHHQRQDPREFPVGFAEGLPLFFRDHNGPPMPVGGIRDDAGKPIATGAIVQHRPQHAVLQP